MCEYLRQFSNPTSELTELLSSSGPAAITAEVNMDRLYGLIIESFNWRDKAFVEDYHIVMGTAIASKTPMTISSMEELHRTQPLVSEATLLRLSPLPTGVNSTTHISQPVRMLHQSLRDYFVL
ncbi:TPR-like protein [Ceratobasidium sp. AG-Ba]|nr:TPR-like protein [Ceratobasidium sp. AG-Ba]QRW06151.1 TPR-like protein [Ceratobasidium sp. AG-Ba]